MSEQLKLITEVEVTKINLQPNETLVITIKDDDVGVDDVQSIQTLFGRTFPQNRIIVLAVGPGDDIKFTSVKSPDTVSSCSTGSYCDDCSCGKKEQFESKQGE